MGEALNPLIRNPNVINNPPGKESPSRGFDKTRQSFLWRNLFSYQTLAASWQEPGRGREVRPTTLNVRSGYLRGKSGMQVTAFLGTQTVDEGLSWQDSCPKKERAQSRLAHSRS